MKLLTIIVPVYNVERYVQECLDSIASQTYKDFNLLLVDDGSTDTSGSICDSFANDKEWVRVIHKENGGSCSVRNLGIVEADTRYITFIDSDDFIAKDFIANLVQPVLHNGDIDFVQAGCLRFNDQNRKLDICQQYDSYIGVEKDKIFNSFRGLCCSKLFDRTIILNYNLSFDSRLCYAEDYVFTMQYLLYVNKYCLSPETGYYYRIVNGSLSTKYVDNYEILKYYVIAKYAAASNFIEKFSIPIISVENRMKQIASDIQWLVYILYHSNDLKLSTKEEMAELSIRLKGMEYFMSGLYSIIMPICRKNRCLGDCLLKNFFTIERLLKRFRLS